VESRQWKVAKARPQSATASGGFLCLLSTVYFLLPTVYFLLPTSYFLSDSLRVGHLQCLKDEHILQRDFFQTIKPTAIPAVTGTQVRLQ